MTNEIQKQERNLTLVEKLKAKRNAIALLLDTSGSMSGDKIAHLKEIVNSLRGNPVIYKFGTIISKVLRNEIDSLSATGSTKMHLAFNKLKEDGHTNIVMITDGLPDDKAAALSAALGLDIQILYVGPEPKPAFLDLLANQSGQICTQENLNLVKELSAKIQLLLDAPRESRGAIQL